MLKRHHVLFLALAVMALMVASACGGDDNEENASTTSAKDDIVSATPTNEPIVSVTLELDWFPNANHAGLYVAQEKGYFADENLDVNMYTPIDPSTVNLTVAAGSDDFGINYQLDVLLARTQGVPVVSIVGLVQHPLNSVQALVSSGISRPSDLVGKKVGYPGIPSNEPLLDTMLKADGVVGGLDEVELVNVGFELSTTLLNGTVDACVGCYFTHESIVLENEGHPVNIMRMEEFGVPDFYELVIVVSEDKLKNDPDVVQRFVRALVRGYEDAAADPDGAVDILLKLTGGEVDEAVERPGAELLAPLWQGDVSVGWQTSERWTEFADWLHDTGQIEEPIDGNEAFNNDFVAAAK